MYRSRVSLPVEVKHTKHTYVIYYMSHVVYMYINFAVVVVLCSLFFLRLAMSEQVPSKWECRDLRSIAAAVVVHSLFFTCLAVSLQMPTKRECRDIQLIAEAVAVRSLQMPTTQECRDLRLTV